MKSQEPFIWQKIYYLMELLFLVSGKTIGKMEEDKSTMRMKKNIKWDIGKMENLYMDI
jgi:hypothetical protein